MDKCINKIKKMITTQVYRNRAFFYGEKFSEYQKTYYWTNEQVGAYLALVVFEGKSSALTVTASGDQTFNLITKGITNIDTFDTNKFTEYFAFGLKMAMILKYDYADFCLISDKLRSIETSLEELTEIIKGLLPFMDSKYRIFWDEISDFNYKMQTIHGTNINLFLMLSLEKHDVVLNRKFFNNYLANETNYELLRNRLSLANISFTCADAFNLPEVFHRQYDVILLSNILDYFYKKFGYGWSYAELEEYTNDVMKLLNSDGTLFLHYIFGMYKDGKPFRKQMINSSSISPVDLMNEELIILPKNDIVENGIILKRHKEEINDKSN